MNTPSTLTTAAHAPPAVSDLALLTLLAGVIYLLTAAHTPIGSEVRYLLAGREMLASRDWIVPHLNGVAYAEKPIGVYWCAALSQWLGGEDPLVLHLPAGLATLATTLGVFMWGHAWRGRRVGWLAAILYLGAIEPIAMMSTLTTDGLFAAALMWGWLSWWRQRYLLFWVAMAVAWLFKGPLAIILTGLAVGGDIALSRDWRRMWTCRPLSGILLMTTILAPWHVLYGLRDIRYLTYFYVHINFGGLTDPTVNHARPWWFYLVLLPVMLLPWGPAAMATVGWQLRRVGSDGTRQLLVCLVIFPLLFLSLSSSKLLTYVLPLLAPLLLLVAEAWSDWASAPPAWLRPTYAFPGVLLIFTALVAVPILGWVPAWQTHLEQVGATKDLLMWAALVSASLGLAISAAAYWWRRSEISWGLPAVAMIIVMAIGYGQWQHWLPKANSGDIVHQMLPEIRANDLVVVQQNRVMDYTIGWELKRQFIILGRARELGFGYFTAVTPHTQAVPKNADAVSADTLPTHPGLWNDEHLQQAWSMPQRIWLFVDDHAGAEYAHNLPHTYVTNKSGSTWILSNQPAQHS